MNLTQGSAIARTIATVAITTLTALYLYYPQWHWIPAVILAGSLVGIHAIPAIGQTSTIVIPPNTITSSTAHEPFTGE